MSRSRERSWFVRMLLAVGVLIALTVVGAWVYLGGTAAEGRKELAAVIAETNKLDPRWRWSHIEEDRPAVPDAENSVRVIRELADSLGDWEPGSLRLPDGQELVQDGPANRRLDDERLSCLRDALQTREESVAQAVSLSGFPRGRADFQLAPDVLSTLVPHAQHCRHALALLTLDFERQLHDGRPSDAAVRIHAMLHAGAGLRDEPMLISQLVRVAGRTAAGKSTERILAMTELPDEDLKRLLAHFQEEQKEDLLLPGLRGERAAFHLLFENLESGQLDLADFLAHAADNPRSRADLTLQVGAFFYDSRLFEDHAFYLRRMNEACAIAQLPHQKQLRAWAELGARIKEAKEASTMDKRLILSVLLTPAYDKVGHAALRDQAVLSCTLAALAAERFRLAHGRWPDTLRELCPAFLPQVPTDPFDGNPLRLSRRDDGMVIYSIGKDGEDDGGTNLGADSPDKPNTDVGIRLWNSDRRGLPPESKKDNDAEQNPNSNTDDATPRAHESGSSLPSGLTLPFWPT